MLAYFDHWIKEVMRVKYYFRYADDMVFLAKTKEELHALLAKIKEYLADLKLTLKGNEQVFPIAENRMDKHGRGLDFRRVRILPCSNAHAESHQAEFLPCSRATEQKA